MANMNPRRNIIASYCHVNGGIGMEVPFFWLNRIAATVMLVHKDADAI